MEVKHTNLFVELKLEDILPGAVHRENTYNDFNQEPLLLGMLSTQGPTKKDVDNDGLEDLLLLGAMGRTKCTFKRPAENSRPPIPPPLTKQRF